MSKIFDKFFRVPKGDTHDIKGYGLGLSFAELVMKHHSGKISVRNKNEGGCEFALTFPENEKMKRKILYVEDEPFLGKIVTETLEKLDFEVRWETDGKMVMNHFNRFYARDMCSRYNASKY